MLRSCRSILASSASLLLVAGCGATDTRTPDLPDAGSISPIQAIDARPAKAMVETPKPEPEPAACPVYETKANAPAKVGASAFTTGFGRCGELPFVADGEIRIAQPDGRIVTLEKAASNLVQLSPDGTRILSVKWGEWDESGGTDDTYALYDLATSSRIGSGTMPFQSILQTSASDRGNGRFLPGEGSPFVICIEGHLGILGAEGFEKWGPSEADCASLVHAPNHPVVAFSGKEGKLHVADFAKGTVQQAPIEYRHNFGTGREDSRMDRLVFSPDARVLVHQSAILSGTDYGIHPDAESTILDARTGEVIASLEFDATPRAIDERKFGTPTDLRPFFADQGHLLVIPEEGGSLVLTDDLRLVELKGLLPVADLGGKLLAESEAGLVLIGPEGGDPTTVIEGATLVSVDRNRAGSRLVIEYDTGACHQWVEATEWTQAYCRTPTRDLAVLAADGTMQHVSEAHGRLVGAWLNDEWFTASGVVAGSTEYQRFLVGPNGSMLALEGSAGLLYPAGPLFLHVQRFSTGNGYETASRLEVLDPVTGERRQVREASAMKVYADADRNVVSWIERPLASGPSSSWSLWMGAMPTP